MEKFSKRSVLAAGIVLCGALCASGASAATPEQDDAIQRAGMEYNREYDIAHGYYVPPQGNNSIAGPVMQQRNQAPVVNFKNPPRAPRNVKVNNTNAQNVNRTLASPPVVRTPKGQAVQPQQQRKMQFQQAKQQQLVRQNAQQAPSQKVYMAQQKTPSQPVQNRQIQQAQQTQQRTLVKPEWMKARYAPTTEADQKMQEAAQEYNRKFDMRYVRR